MDRLAFPEELRAMVHSGEISPCEGREDAERFVLTIKKRWVKRENEKGCRGQRTDNNPFPDRAVETAPAGGRCERNKL